MALRLDLKVKLNERNINNRFNQAQEMFLEMVEEDTREYIPAKNLLLTNSAVINKDKNIITYDVPYASYQYYGHVMTDERGRTFVGKGEKKPIVHNNWFLQYSKEVHPKATDRWLEVSRNKKLRGWINRLQNILGKKGRGRGYKRGK